MYTFQTRNHAYISAQPYFSLLRTKQRRSESSFPAAIATSGAAPPRTAAAPSRGAAAHGRPHAAPRGRARETGPPGGRQGARLHLWQPGPRVWGQPRQQPRPRPTTRIAAATALRLRRACPALPPPSPSQPAAARPRCARDTALTAAREDVELRHEERDAAEPPQRTQHRRRRHLVCRRLTVAAARRGAERARLRAVLGAEPCREAVLPSLLPQRRRPSRASPCIKLVHMLQVLWKLQRLQHGSTRQKPGIGKTGKFILNYCPRSWKANVAHTKQTFTDKNILLKIEASHPTHDMNSAKLSRKLSLPPFLQFAFLFSVGGNR